MSRAHFDNYFTYYSLFFLNIGCDIRQILVFSFVMSSPPSSSHDASASSDDDADVLYHSYAHGGGNGSYINNNSEENDNSLEMNRLARGAFRKVTHCIFDLDGLLLGEFSFFLRNGLRRG